MLFLMSPWRHFCNAVVHMSLFIRHSLMDHVAIVAGTQSMSIIMVPVQCAAKDGLFIVERTGCGVGLTPLSF